MVLALEFVKRFVFIGFYYIGDVALGVQIANLGFRVLLLQVIADRLKQMGLAQPDATVDE